MREYKVPELSAHIMKQLKQVGKVQYHFFLQNALTSYACSNRKTTEKQFLWYVTWILPKDFETFCSQIFKFKHNQVTPSIIHPIYIYIYIFFFIEGEFWQIYRQIKFSSYTQMTKD